jgi:aerobic C4-dicarboxylate transport protein
MTTRLPHRIFAQLYFWVLAAIFLGGLIGYLNPQLGQQLKPLGDAFIALIRMVIAPVVFCTVVLGIAGAGDMKKVGRIGAKARIYFELVSTLALALGLLIGNWLQPGAGLNVDLQTLDPQLTASYAQSAAQLSATDFFLHLIPKTLFDAFTGSGDLLQVLFVALIFGWALNRVGENGRPVMQVLESLSRILFTVIHGVIRLAPIGAAGAMAFTIGKYGLQALLPLLSLVATFYLTSALFVILVLGAIAHWIGFNIFHLCSALRHPRRCSCL